MEETVVKYTSCFVSKDKDNKDKPYVVILNGYSLVDGKKRRKQSHIGTYKTRKEAETEKAKQLTAMNTSTFVSPSEMLTGEYLRYWMKEYVIMGKYKPRTIDTYWNVVEKHLVPILGHVRLQDLNERDIEKYYAALRSVEKGVSEGTLQQHHAILHKALKVAATSMKLILSNPAERAEGKPKKTRHAKLLRTWTSEEIERFLGAAEVMGTRQSAFYQMALETGMRKGELCGLRWQDVVLQLGAGEVVVRGQLIKAGKNWRLGTTKNGKERMLPISDVLVSKMLLWKGEQDILRETATDYKDHDLVFTNGTGYPLLMNNLGQREFVRLMKAAKVRVIRFHDLRHTNASIIIAAGEEVKLVSERLGHSSTSITMDIYCHTSDASHRALVERVWGRNKSKKRTESGEEIIYSYEDDRKTAQETPKH